MLAKNDFFSISTFFSQLLRSWVKTNPVCISRDKSKKDAEQAAAAVCLHVMGIAGSEQNSQGANSNQNNHPDSEGGEPSNQNSHTDGEGGDPSNQNSHPDNEEGASGGQSRHPDSQGGNSGDPNSNRNNDNNPAEMGGNDNGNSPSDKMDGNRPSGKDGNSTAGWDLSSQSDSFSKQFYTETPVKNR